MSFLHSPLSFVYYAGLKLDRALKTARRQRLERPVVSIGNISVGGTGKTPLVIKILSDFKSWGIRPAVLTRGYKSHSGFSDEAALLMHYHPDVPIGTGPDRAQSARELLAKNPIDVFILDDGFQHWALHRDVDIVCVDASNPWAGGRLLPHGRLREPKDALSRADLVVLTRLELVDEKKKQKLISEIEKYVSADRIVRSSFGMAIRHWKAGKTISTADLKDKKLVVLSAVGRPQAFESAFENAGAKVIPMRFRDHHYYTDADLKEIEETAKKEEAGVVTTEKDLVKLERTRWGKARELDFDVWVAAVQHRFSTADEKIWDEMLKALVKKR